jgi:hypothetical protein
MRRAERSRRVPGSSPARAPEHRTWGDVVRARQPTSSRLASVRNGRPGRVTIAQQLYAVTCLQLPSKRDSSPHRLLCTSGHPRLDYESHATGLDRNEAGACLSPPGSASLATSRSSRCSPSMAMGFEREMHPQDYARAARTMVRVKRRRFRALSSGPTKGAQHDHGVTITAACVICRRRSRGASHAFASRANLHHPRVPRSERVVPITTSPCSSRRSCRAALGVSQSDRHVFLRTV